MAKINPWKVTGYKAGQNVACKVNYAEKDGYAVTIQKDNLPGFIKTANTLKAGDEILGVFVCVHNGRILLSQLFSAPRATAHQLAQTTVNWEEHMDTDTLDQAYEQQAETQRQQRLSMTGEQSYQAHPAQQAEQQYQAPQSPTDFGQYQVGGGTADQSPYSTQSNQSPYSTQSNQVPYSTQSNAPVDYNQYAPPQQQNAAGYGQQSAGGYGQQSTAGQGQQYQEPPQPPQQYESAFQATGYETPQPNPYHSPPESPYDASAANSWDNPQSPQPPSQYQLVPQSQFQMDLLTQQRAAQQHIAATSQQTSGQQGQYQQGQQAQYESGQQNPYQSAPTDQYGQNQSGRAPAPYQEQPAQQQQAPYQPPASQQQQPYQQPPAQQQQQSPYQQPPAQQQQAYQQPPAQQQPAYQQQQQAAYQSPVQPQPVFQQPPPPEEQWQSPHTQVPTKRFRLRRAIDLVMPPVDNESLESLKSFKIADYDMEWLITDLEGGMRTGCIKATSEQKLSRSAALLYKGRAVGCIYGCKAQPDAKPTEESLSAMLSDLEAPDAVVTLYDLPEDVTLSMSALFLGYPIDNNPDMTAREYCDFVMQWFAENGSTACLAVTLAQTKSTYLVFVYKGKFAGAFFVEEQQFTRDANEIATMFNKYPDARIEASILNADTLTSGMRFGYSLSMARQKRSGF